METYKWSETEHKILIPPAPYNADRSMKTNSYTSNANNQTITTHLCITIHCKNKC